jgi:hypothetical protein
MTLAVMDKPVLIYEKIRSLITSFLDPEKTILFARYGRFPGFTLRGVPSHSSEIEQWHLGYFSFKNVSVTVAGTASAYTPNSLLMRFMNMKSITEPSTKLDNCFI